MKIEPKEYEYELNNENIDICSEIIRNFLTSLKIDKKAVVRYAMTMEEILLSVADKASEPMKFKLTTGRSFFRPCITLKIAGKAYNVFQEKDKERGIIGKSLLTSFGVSPEYSYIEGNNVYSFKIKKKQMNNIVKIIIAVVSALICGGIGFIIPQDFRDNLLNKFFVPIYDTFFNVLGCVAGPMIFLSVAWGIYGIGDAATFKKVGKRVLLGYLSIVALTGVVLGSLMIPFYNLNFSGSIGGGSEASSIFNMILGIIPPNIFSPFVEGNTLQIIFLAITIGIAMLFLGRKTDAVAKAVEQINYIVQFLIEFISKLVPFFIFIVLLKLIWSNTAAVFLSVWKMFAIFIVMIIIMTVLITVYTAIRNKVSMMTIVKKGLPTLVVAFTTASSAATFGINVDACKKKYGISESIVSFGIPLGMVTFKPATVLNLISVALFSATYSNLSVSFSWLVMLIITACILAVATPPIPGGAITAYTVLFAQLGIPAEALALALACDALFDFVDTGVDQFLLPFSLINQARNLGMVNDDILKDR